MPTSKKQQPDKSEANAPAETKDRRLFRGSQREFLQSLEPGDKLTVTLPPITGTPVKDR